MHDKVKLVIEISKKDLDKVIIYDGGPLPTGNLYYDRIFKAIANGVPYKSYERLREQMLKEQDAAEDQEWGTMEERLATMAESES